MCFRPLDNRYLLVHLQPQKIWEKNILSITFREDSHYADDSTVDPKRTYKQG